MSWKESKHFQALSKGNGAFKSLQLFEQQRHCGGDDLQGDSWRSLFLILSGPEVGLGNKSGISELWRISFMNFLFHFLMGLEEPMGRSGSRLSTGNFLVKQTFPAKGNSSIEVPLCFSSFWGYLISYCPCQFVHPGSCLCNLLGCINDIRCVLQGALPSVKHRTVTHNLNKSWRATLLVTLFTAHFQNSNTNVFLIYYSFAS